MKHIFYFFGIFAIIYELMVLTSPKRLVNFIANFKKQQREKGYDSLSSFQKGYSVLALGYIVWLLGGLFTFQWPIFLFIVVIGFIPKKHFLIVIFDSFISALLLGFAIINAYHLNIDVFKLIFNS